MNTQAEQRVGGPVSGHGEGLVSRVGGSGHACGTGPSHHTFEHLEPGRSPTPSSLGCSPDPQHLRTRLYWEVGL